MNLFDRQMLQFIQSSLQIGDQAPTYTINFKKPDQFHLLPQQFTVPDGAVVSIETNTTKEFGAATATIVIENCYGLKSPEFAPQKHPEDDPVIEHFQANPAQREFYKLLWPETWIQISLGYAHLTTPVLTGAIDSCSISSRDSTVTIQIRDNMRYLIDQYIDPLKFGKTLKYPRTDPFVVIGDNSKDAKIVSNMKLVRVRGIDLYLSLRMTNSHDGLISGKAYNGYVFEYLSEQVDTQNQLWYQVKFNNETRWIHSDYGEVLWSSEIIKKSVYIKVNRYANSLNNHVHMKESPDDTSAEIAEVSEDVFYTAEYITTQYTNGVPWYQIKYTLDEVEYTGWISGLFAGVQESAAPSEQIKYFYGHTHVNETADWESPLIGVLYEGKTYEWISSAVVDDEYWHQVKFVADDGTEKTGWVLDEDTSLEQSGEVVSHHSIVEIVGVSTHLNVRAGPSTSHNILGEARNGQTFSYINTVHQEDIDGNVDNGQLWHLVSFIAKDGQTRNGYVHSTYASIRSGHTFDYSTHEKEEWPDDFYNFLIAVEQPKEEQWTASAIVHDIATIATYIGGNDGSKGLDRQICNVITSEFNLKDPTSGELKKVVIPNTEFKYDQNYFQAAVSIVNQLGDMVFRCTKEGDIILHRNNIINQTVDADWDVYDYVDLTEASLTYNIQDIRSRVLLINDNGSQALFEHTGIAWGECKGVTRTFAIKLGKNLTDLKHLREAARSAFEQILTQWRKKTIAIPGNPLVVLGQSINVHDMVTTAVMTYRIREIRQMYTNSGFITQLELDWASYVDDGEIRLLTENIPAHKKEYNHKISLSKANNKNVVMKFPETVRKLDIRLKDPNTNETLAAIELRGDTLEGSGIGTNPPPPETLIYIKIERDSVHIRTAPDIVDGNIKKVVNAGFTLKYLEETNDWYKGIDPEDGSSVYVYKNLCSIRQQMGASDTTSLKGSGSTQEFLNLINAQIGSGYVWGTRGEILTSALLAELERIHGYEHYHFTENGVSVDANKWLGMKVFDCAGLITWALKQMNLLSTAQDYTAEGIYSSLCYPITKDEIQPGDLLFLQGRGGIYHVGVVVDEYTLVYARGTSYGVVQRGLFEGQQYGRLKKLGATTIKTATAIETPNITFLKNLNNVPNDYKIYSNFDPSGVPQEVIDKVQTLSGNILFYIDNCALYNIGVRSVGGEKNEIVLQWTSTNSTPIIVDLDYDVSVY